MASDGDWGMWARVELLRRTAAEQGLWMERTGDGSGRDLWLLADAETSTVVAGLDNLTLADVEAYLARAN